MSKLQNELEELVKAGCSGIWLTTVEPMEVQQEIERLIQERHGEPHSIEGSWTLHTWDAHRGVQSVHEIAGQPPIQGLPTSSSKAPQAAVEALTALCRQDDDVRHLLLLYNFHKFMQLPDVVQGLANQLGAPHIRQPNV